MSDYPDRPKRLLCLSNGHGEDVTTCQILKVLMQKYPEIEVVAMPISGTGEAYRRLGVRIIGPTQVMPSGGFLYMNPLVLAKDLWSGLIHLTWQQLRAVWRWSKESDLILAMGDIVPVAIAQSTPLPYVFFMCAHSSYYEGRIRLGTILPLLLRSARCRATFARDAFTAQDMQRRGFQRVRYLGMPVMDMLVPQGKNLQLEPDVPMIALLPGSRLREAIANLKLQLQLVALTAQALSPNPVQFRAAIVSGLMAELEAIAAAVGWRCVGNRLMLPKTAETLQTIEVQCFNDAFADILQQADLVIGMAGTASEQAVGLGKPVVAVPGEGPAYTYRFAEAQSRLLGRSLTLIGTRPATPEILQQAALSIRDILGNTEYLEFCRQNGRERMGAAGASEQIADYLAKQLEYDPTPNIK